MERRTFATESRAAPSFVAVRRARAASVGLALAALLAGCVRYTSAMHGSGQLMYVGESSWGKREGVWLYFLENGDLMRDQTPGPGAPVRSRTGFYRSGVKIRELTQQEFVEGMEAARHLAAMTRCKILKDPAGP